VKLQTILALFLCCLAASLRPAGLLAQEREKPERPRPETEKQPAAATSPIGIGTFEPSTTNTSPSSSPPSISLGALSRHFGSMWSMYVPGASVMCESAEMIG